MRFQSGCAAQSTYHTGQVAGGLDTGMLMWNPARLISGAMASACSGSAVMGGSEFVTALNLGRESGIT
jgi:hypothetical protein